MKQHITIDQLNELSEREEEKLNEWIDSKGDAEYSGGMTCHTCGKSGLLSIGQMIEFLDENERLLVKGNKLIEGKMVPVNIRTLEYPADGLCDTLWNDVKDVLHLLSL